MHLPIRHLGVYGQRGRSPSPWFSNAHSTAMTTFLLRRPQQQMPHRRPFAITTRRLVEEATTSGAAKGLNPPIATEQTALLYLDNVFPMRMGMADIRQLFFRNEVSRVDSLLPSPTIIPHGFKVKKVHPRIKDGGALIEFTFESLPGEARAVAEKVVARVAESLQQHRASFNMQPIRTFLVKGEPFLEDMVNRYPSPRLRIEFLGDKPVSVEKLYHQLRNYGRVYDIAVYPNPHTSKEAPRYAIAQFTRIRAATSARNCLHGYMIDGTTTRLNVLYERQLHTNAVKDWIMDHPRITIPVVAALLAGLTYSVFDPMREFFIASKVTQRFNPEEYALYRWLRRETWARLLPMGEDEHHLRHRAIVWEQDEENMAKIKAWLREEPETFVVVSGPKGSGKSTLVKATVSDRRNRLVIDCEELINARNISETTLILAKQVGYFPVFTWISSATKLIDTLVTAGTGQPAGLASSPHAQIKKVLETTALTLRDVMPSPDDQEQQQQEGTPANGSHKRGLMEIVRQWFATAATAADEGKKSNKAKEEKRDRHEEIPVVVIDNFMSRESPKNDELWQELAEFAALLVENELAHVVFVTSNVGVNKVLSKALPGKSFETILLSDASPEVAVKYIAQQLGVERVDPALTTIAEALGGRLNELELLVQRLKMNMDPETAFEDIIQRNVVEIRKYGFNDGADNELEGNKLEWTPIQYWQIAKTLATTKSINYAELKWGPYFKGEDKPLWAMERAEVITIINKNGRPDSVRPGKPIMYTVFRRLINDPIFSASMEIESHQFLKKQNEVIITQLQDTVISLSQAYNGRPPREIESRIKYLLGKIAKLQKEIETSESEIVHAQQAIIRSWNDTSA